MTRALAAMRRSVGTLTILTLAAGCGHEFDDPAAEPERVSLAATASELLALTTSCTEATTGRYSSDSGSTANIPICKLPGAFFWKADMDIDCDGKRTTVCNENTDPWYQNQTSATTSTGAPMDASITPFVVIPLPSSRFDYKAG